MLFPAHVATFAVMAAFAGIWLTLVIRRFYRVTLVDMAWGMALTAAVAGIAAWVTLVFFG